MTVDGNDLSIGLRVESTSPIASTGMVQGRAAPAEREPRTRRRLQQKEEAPSQAEQSEAENFEPEEFEEDSPQHRIDSLA